MKGVWTSRGVSVGQVRHTKAMREEGQGKGEEMRKMEDGRWK